MECFDLIMCDYIDTHYLNYTSYCVMILNVNGYQKGSLDISDLFERYGQKNYSLLKKYLTTATDNPKNILCGLHLQGITLSPYLSL